jgi:GTP cyclohydrolase IA
MERSYGNNKDEWVPNSNSTATIVTSSPTTSISSTTDTQGGVAVLDTTTTTGTSTCRTNNMIMSESNTDTTASSSLIAHESHTGGVSVASDCHIRASGQVCICDSCETTRARLLLLRSKQNNRNGDTSSPKKDRDTLTVAPRYKRSRDEYKYNNGDEHDDDIVNEDDIDHDDIPTVTEVRTTVAAPTIINTTTNTISTLDATEQHNKLQIMSRACRTILQCIGEDPDREGLQKTPERWAKALLYLCHGYHLSPSQVTNNAVFYENHNEMVVVRNIDIHSLCEHHMVPFTGHVHIGYIPNGKIIGLSKLARLADLFARRLQVQERLTRQIADAIVETITPLGVAVVMECTHYCMVMRGVQKTGTITTTSSVRGCFESNSKTRAEFFSILHGGGGK